MLPSGVVWGFPQVGFVFAGRLLGMQRNFQHVKAPWGFKSSITSVCFKRKTHEFELEPMTRYLQSKQDGWLKASHCTTTMHGLEGHRLRAEQGTTKACVVSTPTGTYAVYS